MAKEKLLAFFRSWYIYDFYYFNGNLDGLCSWRLYYESGIVRITAFFYCSWFWYCFAPKTRIFQMFAPKFYLQSTNTLIWFFFHLQKKCQKSQNCDWVFLILSFNPIFSIYFITCWFFCILVFNFLWLKELNMIDFLISVER